MPSLQIKDVRVEVHRVLRQRALEAGQSLQEYMLAQLVEQASRPTLDEVLARAGDRAGGSVALSEAAEQCAPSATPDESRRRLRPAAGVGDDGADGQRARERLAGEQLCAPEVIASRWGRCGVAPLRARRMDPRRAGQALADLRALPLARGFASRTDGADLGAAREPDNLRRGLRRPGAGGSRALVTANQRHRA